MAPPLIGYIAAVNSKIIFECMTVLENPVLHAGRASNVSSLVSAAHTSVRNAKRSGTPDETPNSESKLGSEDKEESIIVEIRHKVNYGV